MKRRYVHGPGIDEPLVWYEGSSTSDRRFLHADERGSIVAVTNSSGTSIETRAYGPYGEPISFSGSKFQYTGQYAIEEAGLYYYKARFYAPHLGRFLQADPIGYTAGPNLYAYVSGDPVNLVDPLGLEGCGSRIPGVSNPSCNVEFQETTRTSTSGTSFPVDGADTIVTQPGSTCTVDGNTATCTNTRTITFTSGNNPFRSFINNEFAGANVPNNFNEFFSLGISSINSCLASSVTNGGGTPLCSNGPGQEVGVVMRCDASDCNISVPNISAPVGLDLKPGTIGVVGISDATAIIIGHPSRFSVNQHIVNDRRQLGTLQSLAHNTGTPVFFFSSQRSGNNAPVFSVFSAIFVRPNGTFSSFGR